jgi:hypothetical protein
MTSRDRSTGAKRVAANITVAGVLAAGALASAVTAAADPPPAVPADPAAPEPPPPPPDILGTAMASLANGGPDWLSQPGGSGTPPDFWLSQYPVPAVAGKQPASPFGDGSALSPAYLFPSNVKLTEQSQGPTMYGLPPADDSSIPDDKWEAFKRARGLFHIVMGKLPEDQLGEPLPGTAPPPGSNLPVGTNW